MSFRSASSSFKIAMFLVAFVTGAGAWPVWAASCKVAESRTPSEAEAALWARDYNKAVTLYRAGVAQAPKDSELEAGLVRALLGQQKVQEASDAADAALKTQPDSAVLLTAKAEVQFRQGDPWALGATLNAAFKADPCLARLHWINGRVANFSSLYATGRREIAQAYRLDPGDAELRESWITSLPLTERIRERERDLSRVPEKNDEERHRRQDVLDAMKKELAEPRELCRVVSEATSAELPFKPLMSDATHLRSYGLDVKLNDHVTRLEIDTGASGILVGRRMANGAGLKPVVDGQIGGIGDEGGNRSYSAYADKIEIGKMEFHNCIVHIVDESHLPEGVGLIGLDVFSQFLVTVDYPRLKVTLAPLPQRPGDSPDASALDTQKEGGEVASTSGLQDRYVAPEMKDYTHVFRRGHDLLIPVALNKSKLKLFILDTGAWATSISPAAAREVTKVHTDRSTTIQGLSGKVKKVYSADDVTFNFGGISQQIIDVPSFDAAAVSSDAGVEISGFLGARMLQVLTLHIDYRDGLIKFDYDKKAAANFNPLL